MAIIGGLDIHRKQLTFDYVETETGRVERGRIAPADRERLADWLSRFESGTPVAFALEGCTGWRYVVEEMHKAGVQPHLAEPADTAALRGPKRHAKTDKADAKHLRDLLDAGRLPECYIPPEPVLEWRAVLELYSDLRVEHTGWAQRVHATCFHQGTTALGDGGVVRGSPPAAAVHRGRSAVGGGPAAGQHRICPSWTLWPSIWTGCAGGSWQPPGRWPGRGCSWTRSTGSGR